LVKLAEIVLGELSFFNQVRDEAERGAGEDLVDESREKLATHGPFGDGRRVAMEPPFSDMPDKPLLLEIPKNGKNGVVGEVDSKASLNFRDCARTLGP
jgi:hypothetical protein